MEGGGGGGRGIPVERGGGGGRGIPLEGGGGGGGAEAGALATPSAIPARFASPSRFQNGTYSCLTPPTFRNPFFASPFLISSRMSSALGGSFILILAVSFRATPLFIPPVFFPEGDGTGDCPFGTYDLEAFVLFGEATSASSCRPSVCLSLSTDAAATFRRSFRAFSKRSANPLITFAKRSGSCEIFVFILSTSSP